MQRGRSQIDYEPVRRSRGPRLEHAGEDVAGDDAWPTRRKSAVTDNDAPLRNSDARAVDNENAERTPAPKKSSLTYLKRGHSLTYAALFLFTVILYARPAEFYPSPLTASLAFYVGVLTLLIFLPSQLSLEGTLTARPREVNLVLLFCLTALLSIPLAISPGEAWGTFSDTFIRCVLIFIVMVNAVRTEARLKGLLFLTLIVSLWLSLGALNDFRLGLTTVEGYRVAGKGSGIFGNSNDMALHLVTILPISVALLFSARNLLGKIFYGVSAALMMAAIVVTYSRGGFLGLLVALGFLAWKLGQRHRLSIIVLAVVIVTLFLALAPGNYANRLLSIFVPSLDPVGSSDARREELMRSLQVAVRHPLLGIGMGNYATEMSYRGQVSHNSYTQVASELGALALIIYTMFIVSPLRRLGQMARETFKARTNSHYYYLSVGLQASLIGYMVTSFFASVAYLWYIFYLVAYAVCLRRLYESETGQRVVLDKEKAKAERRLGRRVASPLLETERAG